MKNYEVFRMHQTEIFKLISVRKEEESIESKRTLQR